MQDLGVGHVTMMTFRVLFPFLLCDMDSFVVIRHDRYFKILLALKLYRYHYFKQHLPLIVLHNTPFPPS